MADYALAYRDSRGRIIGLVRDLDDDQLDLFAPATPEWRVRDIVAHLTGVCADILAGNLAGVASDGWTAKQVGDRRDVPIDQMLGEWEEKGAAIEALVPDFPEVAVGQMIADTATHEQDVRGALGAPGARDSDAVDIAVHWGARALDGSQPLRLETDADALDVGDGTPVATVEASRFELLRAMTGRRSLDQMRAYGWEGAPCPERLVLSFFTPRAEPLVE
ncbi:MAG: maleylpyruvate isomerase family mycothiol-dependent enzyme [Acidimicrobiia bacterium]